MIENMIKPYAAKLENNAYQRLKRIVMETIKEEDKKRGIK